MAGPAGASRTGVPTVFLHIGTPKSGTTYLQGRLAANHERAAAQGLLWPGPSWERHVAAARDIRRLQDGKTLSPEGAWTALAREVTAWRGDSALISMEWLSSLTEHQVEAAVDSLRPARVEVICTARDLLRSFVAQGQEMSKNYRTWTWARLEQEVLGDTGGPAHETFWRQQDVPRILRRWLAVLPRDQVHLVTVPPAGADPDVLWQRFCAVLGIDGSGFAQPRSDNASMGVVSTRLMQRLNVAASAQGLPHPVYKKAVHRAIGVGILGPRRKQEDPIALSDEMDRFLRERAEKMVCELEDLGVDLRGDWDDLRPAGPLRGRRPTDVSDSELLDLCADALVTLAVSTTEEIADLRRRLREKEQGVAEAGLRPRLRRAGRRARRGARRALASFSRRA